MSKTIDNPAQGQYDEAGNARHYDSRINSLVKIERVWGTYEAMIFCEITEFKYRTRIGEKPGQPLEQELIKAKWYKQQAERLQAKLGTTDEIVHPREQPNILLTPKSYEGFEEALKQVTSEDKGEEYLGCRCKKPEAINTTYKDIVAQVAESLDFKEAEKIVDELHWARGPFHIYFEEVNAKAELYKGGDILAEVYNTNFDDLLRAFNDLTK